MMLYVLSGLFFGFFIPYTARRFEKFMPATFAYALYRIFRRGKNVSAIKRKKSSRYIELNRRYMLRSVMWGLACGGISLAAYWRFGGEQAGWHLFFIWSLLLLTEIDWRMYLLPDILTVPLLLVGFLYAALAGGWVVPAESAIGAFAGYFLPVVASLFLVWKDKDMFGGGDIKLLAGIGAWTGADKLIYVILTAVVIFGLYALVRRQRSGAFGPAIAAAAIIIAFYFF